MRAVLRHLRFDQEYVLAHVHAVDDSLLAGILAGDVLVEKGKGALVRRGRQADHKGVEVVKDLAPHVVDGAVALVHDDAVEGFRRNLGVVHHGQRGLAVGGLQLREGRLFRLLVQLLALENGVHALDGADIDLGAVRDVGTPQAMHRVDL